MKHFRAAVSTEKLYILDIEDRYCSIAIPMNQDQTKRLNKKKYLEITDTFKPKKHKRFDVRLHWRFDCWTAATSLSAGTSKKATYSCMIDMDGQILNQYKAFTYISR